MHQADNEPGRHADGGHIGSRAMHPRNPYYNKPPNFDELAEQFPTFGPL